ncbi:hypothetical protein L6452_16935 [Arctium lappa]|uniref:Uncharacterized protein n=1 Tax=Arctium lappa TaxID=4217 RepID=A0ACB9C1W3_ARCLA|nr:hypothetical protein L6452_16935 [Arctium lappa]
MMAGLSLSTNDDDDNRLKTGNRRRVHLRRRRMEFREFRQVNAECGGQFKRFCREYDEEGSGGVGHDEVIGKRNGVRMTKVIRRNPFQSHRYYKNGGRTGEEGKLGREEALRLKKTWS